ncbi:MAG: N-acetyltransferase O1 (Establishment of cohesion protein 1) [Caeruleum heppii]|nr:MAG: N-acetyltransferase O1 (Establishment of cohesion protein 1) [Caeruleum heppii]
MSALLARQRKGPPKTYGRRAKPPHSDDAEPAVKKRCAGVGITAGSSGDGLLDSEPSTVPSSPRGAFRIFSSDPIEEPSTMTPPSSPPPRMISPKQPTRRSTFFSFRRQKVALPDHPSSPAATPLTEINNVNRRKSRPAKKRPRLAQMQIDLGGEMRKTCKTCGMDYIPSSAEDVALHKRFHAMNVGGVDVSKVFGKGSTPRTLWRSDKSSPSANANGGCSIHVVDRSSPLAEKNLVKKVLEIVNAELSASIMTDECLWSQLDTSRQQQLLSSMKGEKAPLAPTEHMAMDSTGETADRFKVFLYVKDRKCVGLCLAERIFRSHQVIRRNLAEVSPERTPMTHEKRSTSLSTKSTCDPAMLGIARIWTSSSHRRKGIAMALLQAAMENFVYGMTVPRELMAFSQPTERGGCLARSFFGADNVWRVYVEQ